MQSKTFAFLTVSNLLILDFFYSILTVFQLHTYNQLL